MVWIIVAQVARGAVIWTANRTARKVLKTVAVASITVYLTKRYKSIKQREERRKF